MAALGAVNPAGRRLGPTEAWGKHRLTRIKPDLTLHTHLRMDGSWTILGPGKVLPRRLGPDIRVRLALDDGRTAVALKAPVVQLVRSWAEAVGHLGPDPLRPDWSLDEGVRRLLVDPDRPLVGRAGRPCLRCATPILFRPASGRRYERETWWCPHCQPR